MALLQGDVASAVGTEYTISGAYIDSNDLSMTNAYIDNYVPMGDLRGRDEFESDEMYQIYLEDRESTDFTKTTFYTERYLDELHNRKDSQLIREFLLAIAVITIGLIAVIVFLGLKARLYIKKDVVKDVRNNYSIEQETKMFNGYFVKNLLCYMLICVVSAFVSMLLFGNQLISAVTIGVLIAVFVAILLVKTANIGKLKREFATKVKEKNREG